jgi:hypothetical protein
MEARFNSDVCKVDELDFGGPLPIHEVSSGNWAESSETPRPEAAALEGLTRVQAEGSGCIKGGYMIHGIHYFRTQLSTASGSMCYDPRVLSGTMRTKERNFTFICMTRVGRCPL